MLFYLDSLCFGAMAPANGIATNNPWAGMDTIALFSMVWMFPGTGQDYPLGPGESAVIGMNAADHTTRSNLGLNLAKAHFGVYHPDLTMAAGNEIAPGVTALIRIIPAQGNAYSFSVSSPAPVIFRPVMGVARYLSEQGRWERYQPGSSSGMKYWHIAKEWILDGVDCTNANTIGNKRFPLSVDAGFAYVSTGANSGLAVRRKVEQVLPDSRIVYQDTNNSSEDFEMNVVPNPRLKP